MRSPTKELIPLFRPSCSDSELQCVSDVLRSGWWGLGNKTAEFEKKFAEFVGSKYAVGVNSATTALDLTLKASNITSGEVIVPALAFVSTGLVVLYNKCKVVFADVDERTLCIDWNDVKNKTTKNTVAVIPVHYSGASSGIPDDMHQRIKIIEDCAHACGNKTVGRYTSCWSFHAVKNLAAGDGGMITTNDKQLYERLLPMRWCGIDKSTWERSEKKYGWDYSIETMGYKSHMNDITASIGLAQLGRLNELNNRRRLRVLQYLHDLGDLSWLKLPRYDRDSAWHMFVVRTETRDKFIDYLLDHGISAGVHYKPLNTYPLFPSVKLPVTDRVWKTLVTLPLFPDMTDEEYDYIILTIREYRKNNRGTKE